ncbi:MAG TPA: sugar phosphate nucleotidyltransferase [Nocardioidaceae bacterium]|nr:sugar phosphate nucleotidyltransferase [Nocardioidaceae bacterium]
MTADPTADPTAGSPGVVGVIMAGGQGTRMQASGEPTPKPLVSVLGSPLVERNVMSLLRFGIVDVRVVLAAGARGAAIADWCAGRGTALADAAGGRLTAIEEHEPLGNCGGLALATRGDRADALLLFADNLTDLDLSALVRAHRDRDGALTLAVHDEPFTLPYGVVDETDGAVTAYREKPALAVSVSSGLAVVSAEARDQLTGPAGLSDFANRCVDAGLAVVTHRHRARWIDVNDTQKIAAAEAIVQSAPAEFEQFWATDALAPSMPSAEGPEVSIDDLDARGRCIRISTSSASREAVSADAWRRVRAWQSALAHEAPE